MRINLSALLDNVQELLEFEGKLNVNSSDISNRDIAILGPVNYKGNIYKIDGQLTLDMVLTYEFEEDCHRCLATSKRQVESSVAGQISSLEKKSRKNDHDLEAGYEEIFYYENEELKLDDYILNQVIVSLPMKNLCSNDCKGLCPQCGIDLNNEKCDCVIEDIDPRLEKLKNFFPK